MQIPCAFHHWLQGYSAIKKNKKYKHCYYTENNVNNMTRVKIKWFRFIFNSNIMWEGWVVTGTWSSYITNSNCN